MLLSYSLTILCLLMLHFFRLPLFPSLLPVTSQGEDDDLLVHNISSSAPTPILVPIKPLITQVYSCRKTLQSLVQHRLLRHQIQSRVMIFQLLSVKVNISVLTQSLCLLLITICCLPLVPLLTIVVKGAKSIKAQKPPGALRRKAPLRRGLFYVRCNPF